jgi:(p)ppGpp synthase/HD superfamily hydrolase
MLDEAIAFATEAHKGQFRKYLDIPYITHPIEVMEIVRTVPHTKAMLIAAVIHDTVEDTAVTFNDIRNHFGEEVMSLVMQLTDVSDLTMGSRAIRKEIDRQHTAKASAEAKTIKLADLISNTASIVEHGKDFAKVYLPEKARLLEVLTEGDATLYEKAKSQTRIDNSKST